MSVKSASKTVGAGFLSAISSIVTITNYAPRKERIEAIDKMIEMLQEERARLVEELIDPTDL